MSSTASNQGRTIVTQATQHVALFTAPDMCFVPGTPPPQPFPNVVQSEMLAAGKTVRSFIAGAAVWTAAGELGPPSKPAHPGTAGGVKSGTYIQEAKPTSYSPDVFFEGNAVVRVFDTTTQNHANTVGFVIPEAMLALLGDLSWLDCECMHAAAEAAKVAVAPGGG